MRRSPSGRMAGMNGKLEVLETRIYEIPNWTLGVVLVAAFAIVAVFIWARFRGRKRP